MNSATRFTILACCSLFCAGGVMLARHSGEFVPKVVVTDAASLDAYEKVATGSKHELTFVELESIILRHETTRSHHGRIEFGSIKMEAASAVVQVLFFEADGEMNPFFYTLTAKNNSWKVESVVRIWFVPRSRLLRGLRV